MVCGRGGYAPLPLRRSNFNGLNEDEKWTKDGHNRGDNRGQNKHRDEFARHQFYCETNLVTPSINFTSKLKK